MKAFKSLGALRERPIPEQTDNFRLKQGYRSHPLDLSHPAAREPLTAATEHGLTGQNYYSSLRNPPHYKRIPGAIDELLIRSGVAKKLCAVQLRLSQDGLGLWLFDAWRPTGVQAYFHDRWMPRELRKRQPELREREVVELVETYWAAPTVDPNSPSPHLTGAAVDLTLCWADTRERLWMGSLFDDVSELAHLARFEGDSNGRFSVSDDEARANRRLLYWVMTEAGFSANPAEWWHFSFGDQMWARLTGAPSAFYGVAAAQTARVAAE